MNRRLVLIAVAVIAASILVGSFLRTPSEPITPPTDENTNVKTSHSVPPIQSEPAAIGSVDSPVEVDRSEREQFARDHFGRSWLRFVSMRDLFDAHLPAANRGDNAAKIEVHDVLGDCLAVEDIDSGDEFDEFVAEFDRAVITSRQTDAHIASLAFRLDDCNYVKSHLPDGLSLADWHELLLQQAADEGNVIAQLRFLENARPKSPDNLNARVALLEAAVREGGYRGHWQVRKFLGDYLKRDVDPERMHENFWIYTTCLYDPHCDLELATEQAALLPWQQETLRKAAARLTQRLKDPPPISFGNLPNQPFELPDGSFSFEGF